MTDKEKVFLKIKVSDESQQKVVEKIKEIKKDFIDVDASVCAIERTRDVCSIFLQINITPDNNNVSSIESLFFVEKLFAQFFNYYISYSQEPSLVSIEQYKARERRGALENV